MSGVGSVVSVGSTLQLHEFQKEGVDKAVNALVGASIETHDGIFRKPKCFLLFDEMGLGKTLQSFEILKRLDTNGPTLVVVPSSCVEIWSDNKHYSHLFDIRIFLKDGVSTKTVMNMTNRTIVITSYDTLRNAYKYYIAETVDRGGLSNDELIRYCLIHNRSIERAKFLQGDDLRRELLNVAARITKKNTKTHLVCSAFMKQHWSLLIMDEVHKIRNVNSSATKAIGFVDAEYRLALSGTPIMNNGSELLCIWKFALGLYDLNWTTIEKSPDSVYCKTIIETISLGRKKKDVDELVGILPVRRKEHEEVIIKWLDEDQRQVYIAMKNDSIDMYNMLTKQIGESTQDFNKRRMSTQQSFMGKMQKLRQICLHKDLPNYMEQGGSSSRRSFWNPAVHSSFPKWTKDRILIYLMILRRMGRIYSMRFKMIEAFVKMDSYMIQPSQKMIHVYDMYKGLGKGDKMIIFSTFKVFLERIMLPWLDQIDIEALLFCGASRVAQQKILAEFAKTESIKILLIVKAAGSEGLNMQFDANVCIIMDPHFNMALDEQAAQRIDRIGQEKEVIVRKLYMEGSIDEAMRIMQHEKQEGINAWNGGEGKRSIESQGMFLSTRDTV